MSFQEVFFHHLKCTLENLIQIFFLTNEIISEFKVQIEKRVHLICQILCQIVVDYSLQSLANAMDYVRIMFN